MSLLKIAESKQWHEMCETAGAFVLAANFVISGYCI